MLSSLIYRFSSANKEGYLSVCRGSERRKKRKGGTGHLYVSNLPWFSVSEPQQIPEQSWMLFGAQIHLGLSASVSKVSIICKQRIVPGLSLSPDSNFTTSRSQREIKTFPGSYQQQGRLLQFILNSWQSHYFVTQINLSLNSLLICCHQYFHYPKRDLNWKKWDIFYFLCFECFTCLI